jgi:molybdopterin converting factor small subunit
MAVLRYFAGARDAAGTDRETVAEPTVGAVLAAACGRHGALTPLLPHCQVWVNGEPAHDDDVVTETDEVAVLPPVSGGG